MKKVLFNLFIYFYSKSKMNYCDILLFYFRPKSNGSPIVYKYKQMVSLLLNLKLERFTEVFACIFGTGT